MPLHVQMRRALVLLVTTLLLGSALTACTAEAGSSDQASGEVGAKGLTVKVKGVTASAPAGFTQQGGRVTLSRIKDFTSKAESNFVKSAGPSVRVALGKGLQPKRALTLKFTLDKSKVPEGRTAFAVLVKTSDSEGVTPVQGVYNAKTAVMTVEGLDLSKVMTATKEQAMLPLGSPPIALASSVRASGTEYFFADLAPVFLSVSEFANKVTQSLRVTFKETYPPPKNCSTKATLNGGVYSTSAVGAMFPCLSTSEDGKKIVVELHSTKGIPVYVTTKPSGFKPTSQTATTLSDVAVRTVVRLVQGDRASELFGGESLKYGFDSDKPLQTLTFTNDFITMMSLYAAQVFETILENGEKTINVAQREEILSAAVQCFQDAKGIAGITDPAYAAGTILKGMTSCIGLLPGVGAAWGLIVMLPQVVMNSMSLIFDEVTGNKSGTIKINQIAKPVADGPTWLWTLPHFADQQSGNEVRDSTGSTAFPRAVDHATEQWVGCSGTVARTTYALDGEWSSLRWAFGVQEQAPEGLRVRLKLLLDGVTVADRVVRRGSPDNVMQTLDVEGRQTLVVESSTSDTCGSASLGYGAFLNTFLAR